MRDITDNEKKKEGTQVFWFVYSVRSFYLIHAASRCVTPCLFFYSFLNFLFFTSFKIPLAFFSIFYNYIGSTILRQFRHLHERIGLVNARFANTTFVIFWNDIAAMIANISRAPIPILECMKNNPAGRHICVHFDWE